MKKVQIILLVVLISLVSGFFVWWQSGREQDLISGYLPSEQKQERKEKTLIAYTHENLKKRKPDVSQIKIDSLLKDEEGFSSFLFSYNSDGRKITGLLNMPSESSASAEASESAITKPYPVVVMIRGYVDAEMYETGVGTSRAGEYFAQNGFITLAPDFLGYGGSDDPPDNVWEERFLRTTTVIDLIADISSLPNVDPEKIFLWGHSNGGLIAINVLEITGANYPSALWAPVSAYFPYDILYYTNEFDDKGRELRKALSVFEEDNETSDFSYDNYLSWIQAPIILHQGKDDDYIPLNWSVDLAAKLKDQGNDIKLYTYNNADHNMSGVWDTVVERDLEFFLSFLD